MRGGWTGSAVGACVLFALSGTLSTGAQDPKGGPDDTAELLLFLAPGSDPAAYARDHGLTYKQTLRSDPDAHVFAAVDAPRARAHRGAAGADPRVRRAYLNRKLQRIKCAWVPNDPYYPNGSPAGFPGQWHLGNGAVPGVNIKVPAAWANDITGLGVTVGIVDDGLQIVHPDLAPNYLAADSWDFGENNADPSPVTTSGPNEDRHGTSVSGVAAARGGNAIGGTGAAPQAGLAGLRIDFVSQTTAMFVDATQYHSSASSLPLAIKVKNHSYGYSVPFVESQAERDAVALSAASGTIHLFAAGNERGGAGQDSNKQDVQSSPDVIAVAAFASNAKFSSYSSFGANVFVTAPSSGVAGFGITTTDRPAGGGYNRTTNSSDGDAFPDRDYTSVFGGTSSATPLATGVMALVKQVQPALDVRFAKHLLTLTSQQADPTDNTVTGGGDGVAAGSAWKTNAAGRKFNQNYGFGLLDAQALTQQAVLYTGVTPLQTESTGTVAVSGGAIPDNDLAGVTRTFPIAATTPLEEVLVTMNVTHPYRGDLEAFLTSPAGTTCRLFSTAGDSGNDIVWTFAANAFWGENPAGTWSLQVRDVFAQDVGTWNSFAVTARMGQLIANAAPPVVSSVLRAQSNPTSSASVTFSVAFSENVTGVNTADFALTTTGGIAGASVSNVSGSGSLYTVTVATGTGSGTIRLDVLDDNSIQDVSANSLNGAYSAGEVYTVDKGAPSVVRVRSTTANGTYGNGASINATVDFTEAVTLVGGNLQIALSTGDVVSIAPFGPSTFASGTYLVGPGDNAADLDSSSPLTLSAGTLRDAAGNNCTLTVPGGQNLAALQALVVDTSAPQISNVNSSTANGNYGSGAAINVTVNFNEAVTLIGGNLQVTLSTGDVVSITPFGPATSASGTYTVGAGDNSADLNANSPLALSAGTLRDAAGNNCALTIPGGQNLANLRDLIIDTTAPSVAVNQAAGQADPTSVSPILFTAVFSESVTGFTGTDVSFSGSTAGGTLAAAVTGGGTTYTISVSGMTTTGTVVVSIPSARAVDAAGNGNTASSSLDNAVAWDVTPPSVTINQAGGQTDPTNASPILFTAVFSKAVTGFIGTDVTLTGATTAVVSGGPSTYTVTVTGMSADAVVTASIPAARAVDAAGNGNLASTSSDNAVTYDTSAPAVTINQAVAQSDPANVGPILFTAVFSETVTGFTNADVSLAGSTAPGTLAVSISGAGPTYTVSVSGMTGPGTVVASIPASGVVDAVGNANTASSSTDATVTFNVSVPTVTLNQAAAQLDPTATASIAFTVVFSESVTGFTSADVSLAGSTAGGTLAVGVGGGGATYTVTVTGMTSSGTVTASIPAGAAQNGGATLTAASTSLDNVVTYDITPPSVTINQGVAQTDPTNVSPIVFTVVFSEAVTGFIGTDLTLTGATTAVVSGGPSTYSVSVSGMPGSGAVTASIAAARAVDAAGNSNTVSTSSDNSVTYDVTAPTVTINRAVGQADPTNASPIVFTAVFSETVTGFSGADVTLSGATTAVVTGGPTTYTVSVSGMAASGVVTASIAAGGAVDAAGNGNAASTSTINSVTYDITPPSVTINQAVGQADPSNGSPIVFTVVFSEAVTGFIGTDVTLTGATTAVVSGGPSTYTVNVSGMPGSGTVTASIAAAKAIDAAGNANTISTSTDNAVTYDVTAPTVTINQAVGQPDPTGASSIVFTVVFNEAVTGFTNADVVLGGTASASAADVTGGPSTYTVTLTGMSGTGTVTASLAAGAAQDAAGNSSAASTSTDNVVTYDSGLPSVTINQAAAQADPTNGATILFTVVFSEPVTGFANADVVLGGTAGATTALVSGGPTTYTVTVSGMSVSGKVTAAIAAGAAVDGSGNASEAATSLDDNVTYDINGPSVTINQAAAQADPSAASPLLFTVVFSEPVSGFTGADVTLSGATTAVVSGGPSTYTVSVTGMAGVVTVTASLPAAAALDDAGNASAASTSADNSIVYDGTPPASGTVVDGWSGGDLDVQSSATTIAAHWSGFSDAQSGIAGYEWAIGTSPGGVQILAFSPVGLQTAASTSAVDVLLSLSAGQTYYVTVRATNGVGSTSTASSDGVLVSGPVHAGPSAPTAFFATPDDQQVLLDWAASPDAMFYRIWWKPSAAPWTAATLVDAVVGEAATISGLVNGTTYNFRLKAVDADDNESPGVVASATPLPSITIGGLGDYATVPDALAVAVAGETIHLGPGTYPGPLTLPPGVSIEGTSPLHTIITGGLLVQGTYLTDPTSTISDLTITGGSLGVGGGTADVLLDHLVIHHVGGHGATSSAAGRLRAVSCTVMSNAGDGLQASGTASARNCIAGKNTGTGLNLPAGSPTTYNDAYSNTVDLAPGLSGPGNLSGAAVFVEESLFLYREQGTSPSVDAGDPADAFAQEPAPNGARINMGAFGNTRWAASKTIAAVPAGGGGGGGGGGGCGLTGLEALAWLLAWRLRRRRHLPS